MLHWISSSYGRPLEQDPVKNKTSSERRKQFSFDDENELERGANSPPPNGRIDETTGTQADSRHKNMGDNKPPQKYWTIDFHTMSLPGLSSALTIHSVNTFQSAPQVNKHVQIL